MPYFYTRRHQFLCITWPFVELISLARGAVLHKSAQYPDPCFIAVKHEKIEENCSQSVNNQSYPKTDHALGIPVLLIL